MNAPVINQRGASTGYRSMVDLLLTRAAVQPNDRAYIFISDRGDETSSLTFAELERRARALANRLIEKGVRGDRALLTFPPGLDFIVGLFACMMSGMIAVPMMPPRRTGARDSSASIVVDCAPRFALTSSALTAGSELRERLELDLIEVDASLEPAPSKSIAFAEADLQDLALLQYTSGSTSSPKGVMVSHGNLLTNSEMIRIVYDTTRSSNFVSWLPLYHDMGLILNVLHTIYVGSTCILMAPVTFMQRPLSWLRAIHDYQAEIATAPNFALDLCVDRFSMEKMAGVDL
ncbi:MAG: LongchainfattyacidCoA ligase, partial [Nitrobacter vulgaris]|nr:LongchainfattyacidCoA ligase [Nitrobacter vulgaris]